jgi:hypothetical protein
LLKIEQTSTLEDRTKTAQMCTATLNLTMPTLVDREDNKVNQDYAGWPDRMYIVGVNGLVAYQGRPGPAGFKVNEVEEWLRKNVGK